VKRHCTKQPATVPNVSDSIWELDENWSRGSGLTGEFYSFVY